MTEDIKKDDLVEVEAPAKAKKTTKKSVEVVKSNTVTIKLVKSLVGRLEKQKACAAALGLKKIGDVTVQPDNAATKGKIAKISHLVEVTK